jgi:hypothetical protein
MATLAQPLLIRLRPTLRPALIVAFASATIAAFVQSFLVPLDCDVSWLITVNEKMLAGQRLYVDLIEVNPPASVWLYTPAVWIAQQLKLRPEAVIVAAFIAAALASCGVTLRISERLRHPPNPLILTAVLSFVTLVLPLGTFAQREHAAMLLALPPLTALAALAERRTLSLAWRIAVGVAAGLVITIKPHFALVIVPAVALAAWQARALKPLMPIAAAAITVVASYAIAILLFAPDYLRLVPMLTEVYLALREQWSTLLRGPVFTIPLAIYALAFALRPRPVAALPAMFLIGSGGFATAALIQGRGYLNHALPGMALGFVGLLLLASNSRIEPKRRALVLSAAAALAGLQLYAMASIRPVAGLAEAVARVAPPRPSVIALGPDLLTGHPLVRNVDGRWAGSRAALFIAAGAHRQIVDEPGPASARFVRWYQADLNAFANDVERERPDVILVDARADLGWLREQPQIQRATAAYRPAARAGDVEVWVRR